MTNEQRYIYFESGKLQKATEIELLDWAGYWATAGLDEITDPLQKAQMKAAINLILSDLGMMIRKVSRLAISYDVFKDAVPEGITDNDIHTVIVNIMAFKLAWLTGIESVAE
jgi:hypothetical protein